MCVSADKSWSATFPIFVSSDHSGSIDGHNYIDLALPSGTLWADVNIGADKPEDYGSYFAWGETTTKKTYSWNTYKYYGGSVLIRKYCTSSDYGKIDNLTELEPGDDAAYVTWGEAWCMPSKKQFEELMDQDYTEQEWTQLNGVYGCKVTSRTNGKSIFLPAAGLMEEAQRYNAASGGYYWTRTLHEDKSGAAYYRYFYQGTANATMNNGRYGGKSVRPVRATK